MTAVQRAHGKLHGQNFHSGGRILDEVISAYVDSIPFLSPNPTILSVDDAFGEVACQNDASFIGAVESATANPTEDGTFLFTDYDVRIRRLISGNPPAAPEAGQRVIVTRPGGALQIEDTAVEAIVSGLPFLKLETDYLFLVQYLPSTKTYSASKETSAFLFDGERFFSSRPALFVQEDLVKTGVKAEPILETIQFRSCR